MSAMKTPGVYIVEKNAFPNSVVEVATAIPAFIGYTEKAVNGNNSLLNKPWKITSIAEFILYFGGAPTPKFHFTVEDTTPDEETDEADEKTEGVRSKEITFEEKKYLLSRVDPYSLYYQMLLFYANGGGPCYIVSVGDYTKEIDFDSLKNGLLPLEKEQEPTMIVIPEAVALAVDNCYSLQQAVLNHCGYQMKNRFALLDIYDGYKDRKDPDGDVVNTFREKIGSNFLDFGAAYYPWLNTTIVQESEISFANLQGDPETAEEGLGLLVSLLKKEFDLTDDKEDGEISIKEKQLREFLEGFNPAASQEEKDTCHKVWSQISSTYSTVMKAMVDYLNLLPVSAAMAGIYTMVDNTRGVWKAPANVSISSVVNPVLNITQDEQEDLNVPINGKAVNAIRIFTGEGNKVWGARTLDGNSLDWRYINVRRTMIMLQESIKNAARAYVFDPNDANTWVNVKCMISNFLNGIWKRGGLAGASPDDAYSVHVGLGDTMTPEDILEGIMRITVLVAMVRPAEFIEITFQQQMQEN